MAFVIEQRQAELFEIVGTLRPSRRFTSLLDSGQQQPNQHCDNGNDDQ